MRIIVQSTFLLFATTIYFGCVSSKDLHPDSKIVFGNYGGFVGSYTEFTIFGDGETIYKSSIRGSGVVIRHLDPKVVKDIYQQIHDLKLYELRIHNPGNLSYFLKFEYDNKDYELLWGGEVEVPKHLRSYYALLSELTKDRNPIM